MRVNLDTVYNNNIFFFYLICLSQIKKNVVILFKDKLSLIVRLKASINITKLIYFIK